MIVSTVRVECGRSGIEPLSWRTKDHEIYTNCCFSSKHATIRNKNKDWMTRNNVSEWSNKSTPDCLFQWASTINIQLLKPRWFRKQTLIIIIIIIIECSLFSLRNWTFGVKQQPFDRLLIYYVGWKKSKYICNQLNCHYKKS